MIDVVICGLAGLVLGRIMRRLTPAFLGLKDRKLPFSWPWVELAGALLFAVTAWSSGVHVTSLPAFVFALLLLAIVACDYGWKLIPDYLTLVGILIGVTSAVWLPSDLIAYLGHERLLVWLFPTGYALWIYGAILSIAGAVIGFGTLEGIRRLFLHMTHMEVMGKGDAKLMAMIGAFLGPQMVLVCLLPASVIGIVNGLIYRWIFRVPHAPFAPALALGAWIMLHFHGPLVAAIDAFYGLFYRLPATVILGVFAGSLVVLMWLVWRIKQRAAQYTEEIEKDYAQIEEELESSSIE